VCSSRWISERKTYFHVSVEANRLLAGGFGVRFAIETGNFSLIPAVQTASVEPTQIPIFGFGMQDEWWYDLLRIYDVISLWGDFI